jgi:formate/nitrite transporter FocA (FNT family)
MSGRPPDEIWTDSLSEGERRLKRGWTALAATGFAGGIDVFFSIVALAVASSALHAAMPEPTAHLLASLTFGIGFVFITLGRAELFTENFLVPVAAVVSRRGTVGALLRMWLITMTLNFVGLAMFAAIFAVSGVLQADTLEAAGTLADTLGQRDALPAFLSAFAAGTIMTLFTWVVAAAQSDSARVLASLIIGFVLAVPSLNHAIVGFGEIIFGIFAGTAQSDWGDLVRTVAIAIAGNLLGGVGLVFSTRLAQVRGEPDSDYGPGGANSHPERAAAADGDGNGKPADGAHVPAGRR